ncbi:hypothetical protein NQZ79_g8196 [Umbelopsis isabellina]|nr:hypothetical protein NQZ79_g8196 [Umbelopsis isabellina]
MSSNSLVFSLEMASVSKNYLKDVLRALLHSIFFHRLLVNVTPREGHFLDSTVSMTDSKEVEELIEERATEFYQKMSSSQNQQQGKIAVLFYEKKQKKIWFQFSKSEELICWEQWAITITVVDPQTESERHKIRKTMERQLNQNLLKILNIINDHKEHIPSITTTEGNPFPYQVAIPGYSESWGAMIKRLLVTDAPVDGNGGITSAGGSGGSEGNANTGTRISN